MDDDSLGAAPDDLPEDDPTTYDGPVFDEAAGVVAEAEALVEAAALEVDLDATAADLDGVDAALRRLDDGTYGTCEVCSVDLPDDVLAVDPTTRRCPAHVLARSLPGTTLPSAPAAPSSLPPGPELDGGADGDGGDDGPDGPDGPGGPAGWGP